MGRITRSQLGGAWHHVFNRGARRLPVFGDDDDRRHFLRLLSTSATEVRVHAYVLMGNHFHLLLQAEVPALSATMKTIGEMYTRRFNKKYGFDGPLFRSRFRSKPVGGLPYARHLVRYIHRNPIEDGLGDWTYPWSSHLAYVGRVRRPRWLTTTLLNELGGVEGYITFVKTGPSVAAPADIVAPVTVETPAAVEFALGIGSAGELAVVAQGGRGLRNDLRVAVALLSLEMTPWTSTRLAERYGYETGAALRVAVARGRRRMESDPAFAQLVEHGRRRLVHFRDAA